MMIRRCLCYLIALLLLGSVFDSASSRIVAAERKEGGKSLTRQAKKKTSEQTRLRRGKFGKRVVAESESSQHKVLEPEANTPPARRPRLVDSIVVIEFDPNNYGQTGQITALPSSSAEAKPQSSTRNAPLRRIKVEIEPQRVLEIQRALAQKGFYTETPTGVYDDATIEAMRRFQAANRIEVTGYPTAHALRRLGLTDW
jgi:hypothetical protein